MNTSQNWNKTLFHPSMFETRNNDTPQYSNDKTSYKPSTNVGALQSPGRYKFTENDAALAKSNTKYMFKNLYGETLLTSMFFSERNVHNIQNIIRYVVHRETGQNIDNQSATELLVVMRSIFLEYSSHPPLITDNMSEGTKSKLLQQYTQEVSRLNNIVVNAIVPKIVSQLTQYLDYLRDISKQPDQIEVPKSESVSGQRNYRSVTQVLLGSDL